MLRLSLVLSACASELRGLREAQELLAPTLRPERLARARQVLERRSQAVRLAFCGEEGDVTACLRTMDLFGLQFAEVVGGEERADTSVGARGYVTRRRWEKAEDCLEWLNEAGFGSFGELSEAMFDDSP